MKKLKVIQLLLLTVFFSFSISAQTLATQQVTELDVNGLKVLIKNRPSSPTVAAGLFVRGGVRNVTAQNAGIESFMLQSATEASKKFSREMVRREFSRTGSSVGAGSNLDFSVMSLASTRQHFERSWEIFTDLAINPSFVPQDIDSVREKLLTGLRNETDSPESHLASLEEKIVYQSHPYSNSPQGTIENVSRFTAEELRAYHQKVMQTSQLLLVIVGDLDAQVLRNKIADTFGKLPRGNYQEPVLPAIGFAKPTLDVTARTLPTNYVEGIFSAPALNNPDYYAMRVAISILATRIYTEVRVKNNLSYAPSAEMSNLMANTANISVSSVDANRSVDLMLGEIQRLKSESIAQSDILESSGFFLTTYYMKQETNAAQAAELATYELIGGGWRNAGEFLNRIRQVTPQDVQRVSQKYMKNLRFIVLGKPEAINRQIFLGQSE